MVHLPSLNRPVEQKQEIDRGVVGAFFVGAQPFLVRGHRLRRRRIGHPSLMVESILGGLERNRHVEDRLAVLLGNDPPRGERASVANPVDVIDHWYRGVAFAQKVAMQRMRDATLDGSARRYQRLRSDEAAEDSRPAVVGAESAKEIVIEQLEVEALEQAGEV